MSSWRSTVVAEEVALRSFAVVGLPQNADSSVRAIVFSTFTLFEVLASAVTLRLPSFEANAYV